jgi:hypothetical protein
MTVSLPSPIEVDLTELRQAIQAEYAEVALHPTKGFHFHTGRPLARLLGYDDVWLEGIPEARSNPSPVPATLSVWAACMTVSAWWMSAQVLASTA